MRQRLKTNVAKTEQDALTTTGGSHCLIVCRSHRNAYKRVCVPQSSATENHLFHRESRREKQRDILRGGGEGVRGLCLPGAGVTPRWGSWACPPAHLGGCAVGLESKSEKKQKKPSGSRGDKSRHRVQRDRLWCQRRRKQVDADGVNQAAYW